MTPAPAKPKSPRRGEIWWISFGPSVGGEIKKTRPAVILSNNDANRALNRVQVVPLTSAVTGELYPSEAHVTVKRQRSKAIADQLTTVAKTRILNPMGRLNDSDLAAVENAIRIHLGL